MEIMNTNNDSLNIEQDENYDQGIILSNKKQKQLKTTNAQLYMILCSTIYLVKLQIKSVAV